MPGISPMVLQGLTGRAAQGDPAAIETLQQLGYGPDGQPLAPPGGGPGGPPGGMPGGPPGAMPPGMGPPGMGAGPPGMGGGGMPPGAGIPPGGPPMDPRMMQAAQMAQGLRR